MPFTEAGITGGGAGLWREIIIPQNTEYRMILNKLFG